MAIIKLKLKENKSTKLKFKIILNPFKRKNINGKTKQFLVKYFKQ
jgi:hypothetical protein